MIKGLKCNTLIYNKKIPLFLLVLIQEVKPMKTFWGNTRRGCVSALIFVVFLLPYSQLWWWDEAF